MSQQNLLASADEELLDFERNLLALEANEVTIDEITDRAGLTPTILATSAVPPLSGAGAAAGHAGAGAAAMHSAGSAGMTAAALSAAHNNVKRSVVVMDVDKETGRPVAVMAKLSPQEIRDYERSQQEQAEKLRELRQNLKELRRKTLESQGLWSDRLAALFDADDWDVLAGEDPSRAIRDPLFWTSLAHRKGYCKEPHAAGVACPVDAQIVEHSARRTAEYHELQALAAQVQQDATLCGPVRRGDVAELQAALAQRAAKGLDASEQDTTGATPLHWAAMQSRKDMVDVLLNARYDTLESFLYSAI